MRQAWTLGLLLTIGWAADASAQGFAYTSFGPRRFGSPYYAYQPTRYAGGTTPWGVRPTLAGDLNNRNLTPAFTTGPGGRYLFPSHSAGSVTWYQVGRGYSGGPQTGLPWQTTQRSASAGPTSRFGAPSMARQPYLGRRDYVVRETSRWSSPPAEGRSLDPTTMPASAQTGSVQKSSAPAGAPNPVRNAASIGGGAMTPSAKGR